MKYAITLLFLFSLCIVNYAQTNGADTLRAPISITGFIAKYETNAGLLIQRNDSLYQIINADIKPNGELIIRVSAYMKPDEAEAVLIESARAVFRKKND